MLHVAKYVYRSVGGRFDFIQLFESVAQLSLLVLRGRGVCNAAYGWVFFFVEMMRVKNDDERRLVCVCVVCWFCVRTCGAGQREQ